MFPQLIWQYQWARQVPKPINFKMSSIIITILIIIGLYNLNNQMEIANKHYYIKDRKIDLMEVLRLIQLF
mgnify:FL=1